MVIKNIKSDLLYCSIQEDEINISREYKYINNYNDIGATCHFIGKVRKQDEINKLNHLKLEHYPEMTDKIVLEYQKIALKKWNLILCRVIHRVGIIKCNENIVSVLCSAKHRKSAFESCQYIIDNLKVNAPFWKKEVYESGDKKWILPTIADYEVNKK